MGQLFSSFLFSSFLFLLSLCTLLASEWYCTFSNFLCNSKRFPDVRHRCQLILAVGKPPQETASLSLAWCGSAGFDSCPLAGTVLAAGLGGTEMGSRQPMPSRGLQLREEVEYPGHSCGVYTGRSSKDHLVPPSHFEGERETQSEFFTPDPRT